MSTTKPLSTKVETESTRIAVFDIESTGLNADFAVVLCAVVKPLGEPAETYAMRNIGSDDSEVVGDIIAALSCYDVLVAYNGKQFDRRFLNTRALRWGIKPLSMDIPLKDPFLAAKRYMNVSFRSLGQLSYFLKTRHRKSSVDGEVWLQATLDRNEMAFRHIVTHCKADVLVLEEVTQKLVPLCGPIESWRV